MMATPQRMKGENPRIWLWNWGAFKLAFRPDLKKIEASYDRLLNNWHKVDDSLDFEKIGRKDQPFDKALMENMPLAWNYIESFIKRKDYSLLSIEDGPDMLEVNHRVHYGVDSPLRYEYNKALEATTEKFTRQVVPLRKYYSKKRNRVFQPIMSPQRPLYLLLQCLDFS